MFFSETDMTLCQVYLVLPAAKTLTLILVALQADSKLLVHVGSVRLQSDCTTCLTMYVIRVSMKFSS